MARLAERQLLTFRCLRGCACSRLHYWVVVDSKLSKWPDGTINCHLVVDRRLAMYGITGNSTFDTMLGRPSELPRTINWLSFG